MYAFPAFGTYKQHNELPIPFLPFYQSFSLDRLPLRNDTIIPNVEISPDRGEMIEWMGVGVSLRRLKNIDPSRKPLLIYRSNTPNSHRKGVSCDLRVGGR